VWVSLRGVCYSEVERSKDLVQVAEDILR